MAGQLDDCGKGKMSACTRRQARQFVRRFAGRANGLVPQSRVRILGLIASLVIASCASVGVASAQDASELRIFQIKRAGKDYLLPIVHSLEFDGLCKAIVSA